MSSNPSTTSTVMRSRTSTRSRRMNNNNNGGGGGGGGGRLTYWCYQCDMSVSLFSSSPPLHCPHCHGEFLVEMDDYSSSTTTTTTSNPNPPPPPLHPFPTIESDDEDLDDSSSFQIPSSIRVSDAYLLDRLIQHLSSDPPQDNNNDDHHHHHHHGSESSLPASKASVESIPTIKITTSYLASETILCAVCKDEFLIDDEAKQLPCNHIYHFDCILPWLKQHNSCPVCRFRLPVDKKPVRKRFSSRNGTRVAVRFGNLMENDDDDDVEDEEDDDDDDDVEEEEDEALFGIRFRHIARRHRLIFPTSRSNAAALDSSSSPTQMAQAETSSAGPANSGETVSSRMGGGGGGAAGGSGGAGAGAGAGSGRVDEEGDTVMSEVRGGC